MAGTVHKVTYGLAALAALLHLIFAAIAANDAKVATDINDSNAAALKSIGGVIEPDTNIPTRAYGMAIFRSVVAGVSVIYYISHLVVRRKSPHSWFLCSGVDLFIVVFLAVITIVAQVLGEYFIDLAAALDMIFFFIQMGATLLVLLAEFYAIIHGKKLCGLGIGSALKTSVDHLLNGAAPPSDVEDGTSSTAKDRGSVL